MTMFKKRNLPLKDESKGSRHHENREEAHDAAIDADEQPLISHLIALRNCVLKSAVAVLVLFIPYLIFCNDVYVFFAQPLLVNLNTGEMIAIDVASPLLVPLTLALFLAVFTSMPYILHQIWKFIAPGLYLKEKKFTVPLLVSSVLLFYLGIAFAYYVIFPLVFAFFAAITPHNVEWMTDINSYLSFVLKIFFAFGVVFEIPIAIVLLVATRLTTVKTLSKARPYIFVSCFILGMLLTPPDVISQILLAIPAWMLYEFGLVFARLITKTPKES